MFNPYLKEFSGIWKYITKNLYKYNIVQERLIILQKDIYLPSRNNFSLLNNDTMDKETVYILHYFQEQVKRNNSRPTYPIYVGIVNKLIICMPN